MTYAKTQAFTQHQQQVAQFAKVLAHPARVAILQFLANRGECISGDIAAELPLARATVSQHLQELKQIGLIQGTIDGQKICYCISSDGLNLLKNSFDAFLNELKVPSKPCC